MKYETPELTALTPAITAIQSTVGVKNNIFLNDSPDTNEHTSAYADWE